MRITPINYANNNQRSKITTNLTPPPCFFEQKQVLPQGSHCLANFLPKNFAIPFTSSDVQNRNFAGKHETVVIDQDTLLSGDAEIGQIVVKPNNGKNTTRVQLDGKLKVGSVIYEPNKEVENRSWLEIKGGDVDSIKNFTDVKVGGLARVQTITDTEFVKLYGNGYACDVNAKEVRMSGNSNIDSVKATNIEMWGGSKVYNSIAFSEQIGKRIPTLTIRENAELLDGCAINLNGNPDCVMVVNDKKIPIVDSSLGKQGVPSEGQTETSLAVIKSEQTPKNPLGTGGFATVAGMKQLKEDLTKLIIKPITDQRYIDMGVKQPNGILFYGPPGCGKTYLAKALAEETGRKFVEIKLGDIGSPYINQTAVALKKRLDEAKKQAPAIVFLDEIDSIARARKELGTNQEAIKVVNELLAAVNNCAGEGILAIYATNEPNLLDDALMRKGRIDEKFEIKLPDFETRVALLQMYVNSYNKVATDIDYDALAKQSDGLNAVDFTSLANKAAILAVEDDSPITQAHILSAVKTLREEKKAEDKKIGFQPVLG